MSISYAMLTSMREALPPPAAPLGAKALGQPTSAPVKSYVDALAALVPAEVLTLHAAIITVTTTTDGQGSRITPEGFASLQFSFWTLVVFAALIYGVPKWRSGWDKLDWIRLLIPPLAFVGWTMLLRTTAFDAVFPPEVVPVVPRTVAALLLAAILGFTAALLAAKADEKAPVKTYD
jgi:hypothetical protein